MIILSVDKS